MDQAAALVGLAARFVAAAAAAELSTAGEAGLAAIRVRFEAARE
ncbi:MAG TPA: hypothetical protein VMF08_03190 [Candidatus Sulfotelmatobacter sp.]|nr:hypothetical protein [Candidatus Sulfotelmatobacter sp.]